MSSCKADTWHSTGPSYPGWVQHLGKAAYVDMTAVVVDLENGKSSIRLSILNRHPEADWQGDVEFTGFEIESVQVHELYSDDLTAVVCPFPPCWGFH